MSLSLTTFSPAPAPTVQRGGFEGALFGLVAGSAVFATVLWIPLVLRDPDTLWHLTTGEWILTYGVVPSVDTFSFTAWGRPWVAHEWLSEVILALAYRAAGWNGIMMVTAAAAGSAIGIVASYLRRHLRADVAWMAIVLVFACASPSLLARPHLIALPCLVIWTVALVSARARALSPPLSLLPLMTLWANLHGGFIVGLLLAGALAVEAAFDPACRDPGSIRRWGLFALGAVVAASITPHGVDGLLFPFRLIAMKNLSQIQEWQPSDLGHLAGVTVSILLGLYMGLTGRSRLPRFRVLLLVGLVFATMQHVRNGQVFGVLAPLLIADAVGKSAVAPTMKVYRLEQVFGAAVILIAVISLSVRAAFALDRADERYYASAALDHVPAALRTQPVLNEYGFGGLLIFSGIRPFIDGRADLYGDADMDTYFAITRARGKALDEALCRYNITWTIFSPNTVVPALMDRTQGWHRLYSDMFAVIHVRDPVEGTPTCRDGASN